MAQRELSLFLNPVVLKHAAEHGSEITRRLAMNKAGRMIAAAMQDKSIRLYDVRNCEEMQRLEDNFLCTSLAFSPRGDIIASGGVDRVIKLWDIRTGDQLATFEGHTYPVLSLSFSPDGDRLVSSSGDTTLIVWDIEKENKIHQMKGHKLYVVSADWSPVEDLVVSGGIDAYIGLWDPVSGEKIDLLEEHRTAVQTVRFAPDGQTFASGSSDMTINIWNVKDRSASVVNTLKGHTGEVRALSFSFDGKYLVSGSGQKELFVWTTDDYTIQGEGRTTGEVDGAEFLPKDLAFVSADGSGTIIRWEIEELTKMLEPFETLLKEIESDPQLVRKDEHIRKFEEIQSQYSEATLNDKRIFYIMWQCKRALGLLKGKVVKS